MRHLHARWWLGPGLVIIAASVLFLSASGQAREHPRFPGGSAVGVLLLRGRHPFCTASVVQSSSGDLLLTAAHCLGRRLATTLMFAPSYHDERAPFGEWHVTGQVFPAGWFPHGDVNEDFAFLTVHGDVQARAGAERLGYSSPVPAWVRGGQADRVQPEAGHDHGGRAAAAGLRLSRLCERVQRRAVPGRHQRTLSPGTQAGGASCRQ